MKSRALLILSKDVGMTLSKWRNYILDILVTLESFHSWWDFGCALPLHNKRAIKTVKAEQGVITINILRFVWVVYDYWGHHASCVWFSKHALYFKRWCALFHVSKPSFSVLVPRDSCDGVSLCISFGVWVMSKIYVIVLSFKKCISMCFTPHDYTFKYNNC